MNLNRKNGWFQLLALACFALGAGACKAPRFNASTLEGRTAIMDQINYSLTAEDCSTAISLVEGLYASPYTGNDARMLRAASHGCNAQINFFRTLGDLASSNLAGSGFWMSMARLFPSTTTDGRAESAWYATDALMATLKTGVVISTASAVNSTSYNPGSLNASDRRDDSNAYMILISMAAIGSLQNRYSATNTTTYNKTQVLGFKAASPAGWAQAVNVDEEGCSYASSILNMIDAIDEVAPQFNPALATSFNALSSTFLTAMNTACASGCNATFPTGCVMATPCTACPFGLRNRKSCTGAINDQYSCAAAGIAHFINVTPLLGWP